MLLMGLYKILNLFHYIIFMIKGRKQKFLIQSSTNNNFISHNYQTNANFLFLFQKIYFSDFIFLVN